MDKEREEHSHPSFGQIRFARISGRADFYGSELTQEHYISMTIQKSSITRELSKDWYHASGLPLVEIRMSSGQFAEMITSMNHEGIPCTIEMLNQQKIAAMPPQESRKEFVHRKFEDRMKMFANTIREKQQAAKEIVKKKTLSKQDIHDLTHHLEWLTCEVESNIPYFAKCFQETTDQVVNEAKLEVENAIQHKINILGLSELHKQQNLISNKEDE